MASPETLQQRRIWVSGIYRYQRSDGRVSFVVKARIDGKFYSRGCSSELEAKNLQASMQMGFVPPLMSQFKRGNPNFQRKNGKLVELVWAWLCLHKCRRLDCQCLRLSHFGVIARRREAARRRSGHWNKKLRNADPEYCSRWAKHHRDKVNGYARKRWADNPEKCRMKGRAKHRKRAKLIALARAMQATGGNGARSVGRPQNSDLRRRVRELRGTDPPTSWNRIKIILDRETGEERALSTYREYAENPT